MQKIIKIKWLKIYVLFSTFLFSINGYSQNQALTDSLLKKLEVISEQEKPVVLNQLAEIYLKISVVKSDSFASEAKAIAEKTKNSYEEARALKIKSSCYLNQYRYSEAIEASKAALDIFLKIEKLKETAEIYNQLGLISKQHKEFNKAFDYYDKATDYYRLVRDSAGIATTFNYIGSLFLNKNDYDNAFIYYQNALHMRQRMHDSLGTAGSYFNIALVYREKSAFDEALENLENSRNIYEKIKNNNELANVMNLIGSIYLRKNEFDKAVDYYLKSLDIREKSGNKQDIASSLTSLGITYKELNNQKKSLEYLGKALALRKEIGDRKEIAITFNYIGSSYWKSKNYTEALGNYLESLKISLELEENTEIATAYTNIGSIYFDLNNFDKSLEYFSQALYYSSLVNEKNRIANSYLLIGNSYSKLGKYPEALDNFSHALKLRYKLGDTVQVANTLNSIGSAYCDMGNFNKALKYYNEALSIRRKISDKIGTSVSLNYLGNLYYTLNNKGLALSYFEQSLKAAEDAGFTYNIALCSRKIGEIYMDLKNFQKALPYFETSIKLGTNISNLELLKKGYWDIYKYHSETGNYKKALENYVLFILFNDSIAVSMTNKKLLDLQVNFELSKKESEVKKAENEIAILKKNKELNELKDIRRKQANIILLILILFVLTFGILYYNRYKLNLRATQLLEDKLKFIEITNQSLKKKEDELLRLNSTKDKFFSIMAHDIKNPLGGLVSITDLAKSDFKNMSDQEKNEIFEVINKSSLQLYGLLENLLHWSRAQTGKISFNPVDIKLFDLVESNIELLKTNIDKKNIMVIDMIDPKIIAKADKEMITLVLRNLISNAIKFTYESGKIVIASVMNAGKIEVSVEDNGIGISKEDVRKLFRIDVQFTNTGTQDETGTGLGLILCKEFIQKHNGEIWVESEPGKGSKFIFSLPVS